MTFKLDSLDDLAAADTSTMNVEINGTATDWTWTFAGPGHPQTVAQSNRISKERLREDKAKEQAAANRKKWVGQDEDIDDVRKRNINFVVERMVAWSPIEIAGENFPFSAENAFKLLSNPANTSLVSQAYDFLGSEQSFMKRSATN